MENKSFFKKYEAYLFTLLAFTLLSIWYFNVTLADMGLVVKFILVKAGHLLGIYDELPRIMTNDPLGAKVFGGDYALFAPEVMRASGERAEYLPWVFSIEVSVFALMFIFFGRKEAKLTRPDDLVQVFTPFQRAVIWANIFMMITLVISGFNITFGDRSQGGMIPYYLRQLHELTGFLWAFVFVAMTVLAFKDCKLLKKTSLVRYMFKGAFTPTERVGYYAYAVFGALIVISGLYIFLVHPHTLINAETINMRRLMLFAHFAGTAIFMFFTLEYIYSSAVAVKGYLRGLWSGKYPREYLEKFHPEIAAEVK
jgi:cytochrome b subunit of formate dehydrogenase